MLFTFVNIINRSMESTKLSMMSQDNIFLVTNSSLVINYLFYACYAEQANIVLRETCLVSCNALSPVLDSRTHRCDTCGKEFKARSSLKRHFDCVHNGKT